MRYNLLEKTELWITPVKIKGVDLGACAQAAAKVLGLNPDEIMVTDVRENTITLDVLVPEVKAEKIVSRGKALLQALSAVSGVNITPETKIHSEGILGLVTLDESLGSEVLERSSEMVAQIEERIQRRCLVFATGAEILSGQVRDTNTPFLIKALENEGYDPIQGPTLADKAHEIANAFRKSATSGYGILITTGGIGAEGKDQTLEALEIVDAYACMPYILKFRKGQGRHKKPGVRIGVGVLEATKIICLPGPHDEVELAWNVLQEGLKGNWEKKILAEALANALRQKFLVRMKHSDP